MISEIISKDPRRWKYADCKAILESAESTPDQKERANARQAEIRQWLQKKEEAEKSGTQVAQKIESQTIKLSDVDLDIPTLERTMQLSRKATQVIKAIEYVVREELGENANPQHVGMYVNNICDKLLKVSNLSDILDDIGGKSNES